MSYSKHFRRLLGLGLILLAFGATAQRSDSTTVEPTAIPNIQKKALPSLGFIPYYFAPKPLNINLKQYTLLSSTSAAIQKNNSTDNAMKSIYNSLQNDKKMAESYKAYSYFAAAAIVGGMTYQIVNSKRLAKEAQQRREARTSPPPRRR